LRAVVGLIPLPEGSGVDLDDGGAGERVCADEFVVRWMVGDCDDTDFLGDSLRTPGEVAAVETQSTELAVACSCEFCRLIKQRFCNLPPRVLTRWILFSLPMRVLAGCLPFSKAL